MATRDEHLADIDKQLLDIDKQLLDIDKDLQKATPDEQTELHAEIQVLVNKRRELLGQQ